ncbi:enolase C-terminal domain-like protein [Gaiella sp.]|uniref:mandelate racemase/muconate lactonizing enzyme family protein n=1 Tax=Gaiella sp. TaxID=2663207 RepID=UPI003262F5F8
MRFQIESVETIIVRLPPRTDFRWLSLSRPLGEFVLVRISGEGVEGWGEVVGLRDWGDADGRRHGETPGTICSLAHEYLAPTLFDGPLTVGELPARLDEVVVGNPYAKALIDIAFHDLTGRALGVPVHALLGGRTRDAVPVAHMIGLMDEDEAVAEGRAAIVDGVKALQVKGGRDAVRDATVIRRLREELGDGVLLRLDANGGYPGRVNAKRTLEALADAGADLVEQPLLGIAELEAAHATSSVPIVADEACWTPGDALELVRRRAADVLSVYVGKAGGIARAREICTIARAAGLPHDLNGALELGIGNAANLHVALSSPAQLLPSVIPINAPTGSAQTMTAGRYFEDDIVTAPFIYRDGCLGAVDTPGLGVEVDFEKVEHYCVDRHLSTKGTS